MGDRYFQFASPLILFVLIIPLFVFYLQTRLESMPLIRFSSLKLFSHLPRSLKERGYWIVPATRLMGLILLIFGLARPQIGNRTTEILSEGIDILLTIDTSGSMKALDFHLGESEVNRLDVVKSVVAEFISRRPADRMGMVVFGEEAYTQCPLTLDGGILRQFLAWLRIGIAGDGTAVGNALALSVKRIKDQPTKSKVIILLTDGRNNSGEISPLMAARMAKDYNIKVYTIGVGSDGPVPYPEETPFGIRKVYAHLDLDEETLREISEITGGRYFRATETKELEEIYKTIDSLEKSEVRTKEYHEYEELFPWCILGGLLLIVLGIVLGQTVLLRIP